MCVDLSVVQIVIYDFFLLFFFLGGTYIHRSNRGAVDADYYVWLEHFIREIKSFYCFV